LEQRVYHDPSDNLNDKNIQDQKPDRVYGLMKTDNFERLQQELKSAPWSSVFKIDTVLYPFLIVESKSEKGSIGFSYIERQTAFPIQMLLKI
jgi:hypothetical protein